MSSDMAEMQPALILDYFLNDDDCNIQVEYGSVVDAAFSMRRRQARLLKTTLQAKQAEFEHNDSDRTFETLPTPIERSSDNESQIATV